MSPKTTVFLVVLVLSAAVALWFLNRADPPVDAAARRLFPGLASEDVREFRFEGGGDDGLVLVRRADGFYVERPGKPTRRARNERMEVALRAVGSAAFLNARPDVKPADDVGFGLDPSRRRSVVAVASDGRQSRLDVGAPVRAGTVIARQGKLGPAVEIDSVLVSDLFPGGEAWIDPRLIPWYSPSVMKFRVFDRKDGGRSYGAVRQSGRWFLQEPTAVRGDQTALDALIAHLCAVEAAGPAPSATAPVVVARVRLEFKEGGSLDVAFGALQDGKAAARAEPDGSWEQIDGGLIDRLLCDPALLRTRRLVDTEAGRIVEIRLQENDGPAERVVRLGTAFVFVAPDSFRWLVPEHLAPGARPDSRPTAPFTLDPTAGLRFVEAIGDIEAVDFPPTATDFPVEFGLVVVAASDAGGAVRVEKRLEFGPEAEGRRLIRTSDGVVAAVRSADVAFLRRPFYSRLGRSVTATMPHCIMAAEIVTADGRTISLKAVDVKDGRTVFEHTDTKESAASKRLPPDALDALRAKLSSLTVKDYAAFGVLPEHGLERPYLRVRFRDTTQKYEGRPELDAAGAWIEWRIGGDAGGGMRYGETSNHPGLVFRTEPRDLDPLLDFLNS